MRVGIVTLFDLVGNYGNKLQNYALMTKLKSFKLNVYGIDLLISKLECDELLIKGIINKVEKIYE